MGEKLKVGDTLYIVPEQRRGNPYTVPITKVGRIWYTCGEGWRKERVHIERMFVDAGGYAPHAKAWTSEQAYSDYKALEAEWSVLRKACSVYTPPDDVTINQIREALKALGLGGE